MNQIKIDPRLMLAMPALYRLFTIIIGGEKNRVRYVNECVRAKSGDKILDIGCGPADILSCLPDVEYIGFDISSDYIKAARQRFGQRGQFFCERITRNVVKDTNSFNLVLATGILHHLDDFEALELFQLAWDVLKPGGRLITFDGVYTDNQSKMAKYLLSKDRGKYVRTEEEYGKLARQSFQEVDVRIYDNLLRIPYTHIVLDCTKHKRKR